MAEHFLASGRAMAKAAAATGFVSELDSWLANEAAEPPSQSPTSLSQNVVAECSHFAAQQGPGTLRDISDSYSLVDSIPWPYHSPRTAYSWSPRSACTSPLSDVRPQWTPRTSAGRAKLMTESKKWERAEDERQRKAHHEHLKYQRSQHGFQSKSDRVFIAREDKLNALQDSREAHCKAIHAVGRVVKARAEELRQQHIQGQQAWQARGRALHSVNNNSERVRGQRDKLHQERSAHSAARAAERRRHEAERALERAEHIRVSRERAARNRRITQDRVRVSSTRSLESRERGVDDMRETQLAREEERFQTMHQKREANREKRDGVAKALSPMNVRDFKAREQARKAQVSARMREQSIKNGREFLQARLADMERKTRQHDAVRRSAIEGYGDHVETAYSSVAHSGTSLLSSARDDGPHPFKHDLPTVLSPSGRWLRGYAQAAHARVVTV